MGNSTCNRSCKTSCNEKSVLVTNFIDYLKDKRGNMRHASDRQKKLFELMIQHLELSRSSLTMKDVRMRVIIYEDDMECNCNNEDDDKNFRDVFSSIFHELHAKIEEESRTPKAGITTCWEHNKHFCKQSKPYYDRAVELGLMNDDYSWAKETTQFQIALWVDLLARKRGFTKHWVWAESVWPNLKNLKQALSKSKEVGNDDKTKLVESCFRLP